MSNEAHFARSGNTNPFGKCSEDIKSKVPEEVKDQMTALAVMSGMTLSEYVRDMCLEHIYGHMAIIRAKAGKGMPGMGHE